MLILTIRTDKPEAELGLYEDQKQLGYETWTAHRELAETIHQKINDLLQQAQRQLSDVQGIVVYKGPGSFTGLRIGITVANALAYSLDISIIATSDQWIEQGIQKLASGDSEPLALPEYGSEAHITQQKR